jgi:TonB family protein
VKAAAVMSRLSNPLPDNDQPNLNTIIMKKSIYVLLLAVALFAVQACASKSEKEEAEKAAALAAIKAPPAATPTPAERRMAAEKKRAVLAEKRRLAWEERVKTSETYKDKNGNLVYIKAEQDPSFSGGEKAMNKYFRDNVQFPEDAEKEGLDGTVYIDFVVETNGTVGEVTAATIAGETVDQRFVDEALRVVRAMPNWIPGRQHGKAVAVSFSVPVTFEIEG